MYDEIPGSQWCCGDGPHDGVAGVIDTVLGPLVGALAGAGGLGVRAGWQAVQTLADSLLHRQCRINKTGLARFGADILLITTWLAQTGLVTPAELEQALVSGAFGKYSLMLKLLADKHLTAPPEMAVELAQWRRLRASSKSSCFVMCSSGGPPSPLQ